MKILANATACRVAGGRSVALNFLRAYAAGGFPHELVVYASGGVGYEELAGAGLRVEIAPPWVKRGFARAWADHVWFRGVLERERPDVLFAMGSIAYPARVPQVVLFHWPYAIYPEPEIWSRMSVRDRVSRGVRRFAFGRRLRYASRFAAQTETARSRLERIWGLRNVTVVPNAVSLPSPGTPSQAASLPADAIPEAHRALLCLTRYYPHKNLESLLEVGRTIRERGLPWVILTTVSASDDRAAGPFIESIRAQGLERVIVNLGTVPMAEVPALYAASSGLLLPTVLESFSGTYVESMYFGVPIFTSDRDFARDVCGDVAWYFDPLSPQSIVSTVEDAFERGDELARRVAAGRARCERFPSWSEAARRYVALFEEVAR